ncbi:hypothetical protein BpHYR1_016824 [Brachionus plicatilis]|uniref:Uncharacterized protein n=1 Tax=Brachionus plicatilis TaxID=10195 RepID=A0A3M7QNL8_BRAPC|nr:hypothetical protein BpHYR1_016824 [Brachionus plicatilis]
MYYPSLCKILYRKSGSDRALEESTSQMGEVLHFRTRQYAPLSESDNFCKLDQSGKQHLRQLHAIRRQSGGRAFQAQSTLTRGSPTGQPPHSSNLGHIFHTIGNM